MKQFAKLLLLSLVLLVSMTSFALDVSTSNSTDDVELHNLVKTEVQSTIVTTIEYSIPTPIVHDTSTISKTLLNYITFTTNDISITKCYKADKATIPDNTYNIPIIHTIAKSLPLYNIQYNSPVVEKLYEPLRNIS